MFLEHLAAAWPALFPLAVACAQHVWQHYLSPDRNVVRVHELKIYPIKSCRGITLRECAFDRLGFVNDRRWIIVDEAGVALTMRQHARMALIETRFDEQGRLMVRAPGMPEIEMPPASATGHPIKVKVFDDQMVAAALPAPCCEWVSQFLGRPARIVGVLPGFSHYRPIDPKYDPTDPSLRIQTAFADGFPFLIFALESVADLNTRLPDPVTTTNFRPNIVVQGGPAYIEDTWKRIAIGGTEFDLSKACSRCLLTTVDPVRGVRHQGFQPLKTIREYRNTDGEAMFGQNAVQLATEGVVRVGDVVRVIQSQPSPFCLRASLSSGRWAP